MHCPLLQPSWIEETMDLCDQILVRAAKAHPANALLRKLVRSIKPVDGTVKEVKPPASSQPLAS